MLTTHHIETIQANASVHYFPPDYPADAIKNTLLVLHGTEAPIHSHNLDTLLLGAPSSDCEPRRTADESRLLEATHAGEKLWLRATDVIWTPYPIIRSIVKRADIRVGDVVYDLGSAYGRFPLYTGIVTGAKAKGLELLPERARVAQAAAERLQLDNVSIIEGNVLDHDFSDGTVFYMYYPFSDCTFYQVRARLEEVARQRQIRIVTRIAGTIFDRESWLEKVDQFDDLGGPGRSMMIFESKAP